ncbi:Penicillin-binding protein AmpH [Cronobacter sakazakii 701]|nr:Penicillin-binding protein AmpH [Cronobacter sakazakii 701]
MKRCLLSCALLISAAFSAAQAAQTSPDPVFASDIVDRYANHIFYGSGATGMAIVVIDGNQRVFRSPAKRAPAITCARSSTRLSASPRSPN